MALLQRYFKALHEAGLHTPEEIERRTSPRRSSRHSRRATLGNMCKEGAGTWHTTDGLLRLAQERYEADRSAREADLAEQREQLYARRPRLREIQDQLRRTASRVMAAALRRGEDPLPEIQRLREENLSLQAERQMLLAELGLPDNALEDTPLCPFCNDTGYRGGEMCRCLKTYYVEEQRKELSKLLDLGSQSFDTFDTDWYSDQRAPGKTKSAREHMEWVYDTCVEYAHNFGKKPANLLLFGRPGLGKTHLSAAIAREVSGKGFSSGI